MLRLSISYRGMVKKGSWGSLVDPSASGTPLPEFKSQRPHLKGDILEEKYTKFEKARMIGARSLQIAMGSPIFVDADGVVDPIEIATMEYERGTIPITVKRRRGKKIKLEGEKSK